MDTGSNLITEYRFYENEYPEENELVMVQTKDVTEYATIVELLEYEKKEGKIFLNYRNYHPK